MSSESTALVELEDSSGPTEGDSGVVVVGAGLVGLACALSLTKIGVEPLVIDSMRPGSGASWGNGGLVALAPDVVAPVPAPGVIRTSMRWVVQRDSPLRVAPRFDLDYLRWFGRFMLSCSSNVAEAGLRATLALNAETEKLFDILEREGLEFEMERLGVLVVFQSPRNFESARRRLREHDDQGEVGEVLSRDEALAAEPLLEPTACAGAIRYSSDRQVRPEKLLTALVQRLGELGVEIRDQSPCIEIVHANGAVTGVRTPQQTLRGRAYVLASGTGVSALSRQVGVRIPIQGGRGYSFDLPRALLPVRAPVYIHEGRLVLTPFRDVTRVVGMMELGARAAEIRPGAIETMHRVGARSFRVWPKDSAQEAWAGLRPMTPDGLPVIGPVDGVRNLFVAGGHGMLGTTLSLRTGQAIAECISNGGKSDPALRPFAPNRFEQRRSKFASHERAPQTTGVGR